MVTTATALDNSLGAVDSDIISLIDSDSILSHWGSIEPLLTKVLNRIDSGFTLEDVLTQLQWQRMLCWKIKDWEALAITQLGAVPQHKICTIIFVSGDNVNDWLPELVNTLRTYCKTMGAKYLDFYGRDGWRKLAKPLGFDKSYTVMQLEIDHGQE